MEYVKINWQSQLIFVLIGGLIYHLAPGLMLILAIFAAVKFGLWFKSQRQSGLSNQAIFAKLFKTEAREDEPSLSERFRNWWKEDDEPASEAPAAAVPDVEAVDTSTYTEPVTPTATKTAAKPENSNLCFEHGLDHDCPVRR